MPSNYFVYILTNVSNFVLYIGVTNDLKEEFMSIKKIIKGFTSKYNLNKLVYYETYNDADSALKREKQLKNWHRDWKINLIVKNNPGFADSYIN
jgi:putative endonuclease